MGASHSVAVLMFPVVGNINDTYAAAVEPLSFYHHYFDDWLLRWVYYHFVHACEQVALRRLQAVIANSRYTMRVIAEVYHIEKAASYVLSRYCH
jgi:hypothetical protein